MNLTKVKSRKEFQKKWESFAVEISERPMFDGKLSKEERKKRAAADPWEMAKIYFPEYVRSEAAPFHSKWPKISSIENQPVLVEAFRGAGKSSFFTFLDAVHKILFGSYKFMLFGSYTEDKSIVFTARILAELKYNQRILEDFGQIIQPSTDKSAMGEFAAKVGNRRVMVQSCSIGQDPRGLVAGAYRPDYVRLDDIQNRKRAKNPAWVKETVEWITTDLIPALAEQYNMIIVATPVRPRDVVHFLKEGTETRESVKAYSFPAINKSGKPTWPSFFPLKRLESIKKIIGSLVFRQEYQLIPYSEEEGKIQESWLIDYDPAEVREKEYLIKVSALDPGGGKATKKHDFKAHICIGINPGPQIDILDARIRRETPRKMISGCYLIHEKWEPWRMFWEENGQQSLLADTFDLIAEKYGYPLRLQAVTNTQNKEMRIEGTLFTLLENHCIRFHPTNADQKLLKEQLLDLFDGANDDGPDALEMAVRKGLQKLKSLLKGNRADVRTVKRRVVPRGMEGFY